MASPTDALHTCAITINVVDGSRQALPPGVEIFVTIRDGNQREVVRSHQKASRCTFTDLRFFNNYGDRYAVLVSAPGYEQAGFAPVMVNPSAPAVVDVMLLRREAGYNFNRARWATLRQTLPRVAELLAAGASDEAAAEERYENLIEDPKRRPVLACVFNLTTAMSQIHLPERTALDYLRELIWDESMAQDRFFAWAEAGMVEQVRRAANEHKFEPEPGTSLFHPGATCSFKQTQSGEANVQLTFHEDDRRRIGDEDCIKVEPDIDYYKDPAAHALLEVLPNSFNGTLTDPRHVYVLRWIAGRRAGIPAFEPPYTIS